MGVRNISISDEAYARLASLKRPNESFTDVINRLTRKQSILEMAGVLNAKEARELRSKVSEIRTKRRARLDKKEILLKRIPSKPVKVKARRKKWGTETFPDAGEATFGD